MTEYSNSTVGKVGEGEVVVLLKHKGKTYAKAFKLDEEKLGDKVKSRLEATLRVIL